MHRSLTTLLSTVAATLLLAAPAAAEKKTLTAPGTVVKAKSAQVAEWRGPVVAPGRAARVPSAQRMCLGYGRDVFATRGTRRLPERALRRVHGKPNVFRNLTRVHVRFNARCVFPPASDDPRYLADGGVDAPRELMPYSKG